MRRSKDKWNCPASKQQPFNINIEFNINPKNVTHHQESSEVKIVQRGSHSNAVNSLKNNNSKSNKETNQIMDSQKSNKIHKKKQSVDLRETELSNKCLQKLKKCFIDKINNMDIILESPAMDRAQIQNDKEEKRQSIMSAKMVPYQHQIQSKIEEEPQIKLNSFNFKSKMMKNKQISKILGTDHEKRNQLNSKNIDGKGLCLSHNKLDSKIGSHQRGFSNFTDIKSNRAKLNKKKKMSLETAFKRSEIVKQPNLKEKLQMFKLDMMKLANYYEQNDLLKTKISSQYQARSKQISKEIIDAYKITKGEEHQKLQQIKQFQANNHSQKNKLLNVIQIKQININDETHKKHQIQSQIQQDKQFGIAQMLTDKNQMPNSIQMMSSIQPIEHSLQGSQYQVNPFKIAKQQPKVEDFISYLLHRLQKCKQTQILKDQINTIYTQFIGKNQDSEQISNQLQKLSSIEENQSVIYSSVDDFANRQIAGIPHQRNKICQVSLYGNETDQIDIWETNYKEELLEVKRKFWKQYKLIKRQIESRIVQEKTCQFQTRKDRKRKKIMKCLSECSLSSQLSINNGSYRPLQLISNKRFSQLVKEDEKSIPIINNQIISENQCLKEQIISNQELVLNHDDQNKNSQSSTVQHEQIKKQNIQTKKEILFQLFPVEMKAVSAEDKQDVFEFVFIDLCIEIYQDALQYERLANYDFTNIEASSYQRILRDIRNYMKSNKWKDKNQNSRKIGISTSYLTIKNLLQQIIQFLSSNVKIYNSQLTNKQRILRKLNSSLGPVETQILKSLRLGIFNNQMSFDSNVEIQENDLLVLQPSLFLYFQYQIIKIKELNFSKYYQSEERETQRINFLRNCTHIHSKAIFDCLNQILDYSRIYGIWGKPFVWKACPGLKHQYQQSQLLPILKDAIANVMTCTTYVCGLMIDKQQSHLKGLIEESQYVQKVREERMFKFLQSYVQQIEIKWYFHDDEEAEILIELSHLVWSVLIREVIQDLMNLKG